MTEQRNLTQAEITRALEEATSKQLMDALYNYHDARCINWYYAEDVQMFVKEATIKQSLAWLEQNEDELQEQFGEVFRSYIAQYGDDALTINTEGTQPCS